MTYHHFQVGQFITAHETDVPTGPYRGTRLLPLSDGVPQYRLKSIVDDLERAVPENAIRMADPADLAEHLPDQRSDLHGIGRSRKKLA
jgi:hypothetical protein